MEFKGFKIVKLSVTDSQLYVRDCDDWLKQVDTSHFVVDYDVCKEFVNVMNNRCLYHYEYTVRYPEKYKDKTILIHYCEVVDEIQADFIFNQTPHDLFEKAKIVYGIREFFNGVTNKPKYDFKSGEFVKYNDKFLKMRVMLHDKYFNGENINGGVELVVIRDEDKIEKWIPKINDKIQVKRLSFGHTSICTDISEIVNTDLLHNRIMVKINNKSVGLNECGICILDLNDDNIKIFPIESKEPEITSASDIEWFVKKYLENPTGKTYDQLTTIIDCHFMENCINKRRNNK